MSIKFLISHDLNNSLWIYYIMPCISLLLYNYMTVMYRFIMNPSYETINELNLYKNHLNNYVITSSQPSTFYLFLHVFMAISWVLLTLIQKLLLYMYLKQNKFTHKDNKYIIIHGKIGYLLSMITIIGSIAGYNLAQYINYYPTYIFLNILPYITIPLTIISIYYVKIGDVIAHRFYTNFLYVNFALASMHAEYIIWILPKIMNIEPSYAQFIGIISTILIVLYVTHGN